MKVYVVISSYQHGLGEAVEVDAEVFSTIDKARKAIRHMYLSMNDTRCIPSVPL